MNQSKDIFLYALAQAWRSREPDRAPPERPTDLADLLASLTEKVVHLEERVEKLEARSDS